MSGNTNLTPLRLSHNRDERKVLKKYLMMTVIQLVRLLIVEQNAKNKAHSFIKKKKLMYEFIKS